MRPKDAARQQFQAVLEEARTDGTKIEPTDEEARNGWTAEALTAYHQEQRAAQTMRIDPSSAFRSTPPGRANSKYRPLKWRR